MPIVEVAATEGTSRVVSFYVTESSVSEKFSLHFTGRFTHVRVRVHQRLLEVTACRVVRWPERIRQVIMLGSPFAAASPETTNALVGRLFRYLSGMSESEMRDQMQAIPAQTLPVPSTAIYTKSDGIVHWRICLESDGERAENIEVLGSHSGMGFNPLVLHVLADRLAQGAEDWHPFERNQGCRSLMFPKPAARAVNERILKVPQPPSV